MALYAFDGTWNSATLSDDTETETETNVPGFYEAYDDERKWYVPGPGTRFGKIGRALGGTTGMGARTRVKEAYRQLCDNWAQGDTTIDIVGFSRGAALALDFANKIDDDGIRRPGTKEVVREDPPIRFLGLWDVVGSFGMPMNVGGLRFQEMNFGHTLSLPGSVEYCFHAMAMDERRQTFRITRVLDAYETWFRGVHSDIGGGNGNTGLSSIALRWMLRKARAAGLPIKEAAITSHDAKIAPNQAPKWPRDLIPNEFRGFLKGDRFHYTVDTQPRSDRNNPPGEVVRESERDEGQAARRKELPRREAVPM
jgi:uncharacterized protein (DUF2235 family)